MPQFNPEWFASQLFWLLLTFLVLYLLMSKVALPRVAEILQERQEKVSDDLAKAERMQAEAKEAYDAYEQRLHEARSQAQALLREANEAAAAEQARRQADFAKEMDARVVEAESRIAEARKAALDDLESVAAEIAQAATVKLIGGRIGKAKAEASVKAAMNEAT